MSTSIELAEYISSIGHDLVSDYEKARKFGADPNAKGSAIEDATRKKLEALLPSVLDVGQGYVIDSYGNRSRQIDLVVYERSLCPVFSINDSPESTYYPCEGVVAAIEVKSSMGRKEFMDSCAKAESVRKLKRRFEAIWEGQNHCFRRYGQVVNSIGGVNTSSQEVSDSFTCTRPYMISGTLAGKVNVTTDTLNSYFLEKGRNSPDILISLDGCFARWLSIADKRVTNAELSNVISIAEGAENPFGLLVKLFYFWLIHACTAPFQAFNTYF